MTSPTMRLWRWPAVLGALTASGLVSALLSDGWGDVWSWLSLGLPVLVMAVFSLPRRMTAEGRPTEGRAAAATTHHANPSRQ